MSRNVVRDPDVIARLNAQYQSMQSRTPKKQNVVTDPEIIQRLQQQSQIPLPHGFWPTAENLGKSAIANIGSGAQDVATGIEGLGEKMRSQGMPGLSQSVSPQFAKIRNQALQEMQPALKANIPGEIGVAQTPGARFVGAITRPATQFAMGGALASPLEGGNLISQILSRAGGQAAVGAAVHPDHPISGGVGATISSMAGDLFPSLLQRSLGKVFHSSFDNLSDYGQSLMNEAKKAYKVLSSMKDTNLIGEKTPNLKAAFGKIHSPEEAADYLQSVGSAKKALSSDMQEAYDQLQPNFTEDVFSKLNPENLDTFLNSPHFKDGWAKNKLLEFAKNPTATNGGKVLRALTKAKTGVPDKDAVISQLRTELKDNIISPGVSKFGSPEDADNWSLADHNFSQFKRFFGNQPELESIGLGHTESQDITPQAFMKLLKSGKIKGKFTPKESLGEEYTVPQQEYMRMREASGIPRDDRSRLSGLNAALQHIINKHSNLIGTGAFLSKPIQLALMNDLQRNK